MNYYELDSIDILLFFNNARESNLAYLAITVRVNIKYLNPCKEDL